MNRYQQPKMFDAIDVRTQNTFRFQSLDTLTRRYYGRSYHVVQDGGICDPPRYQVQILRPNRKAGGQDVLAVISVPAEAVFPAAGE